MVSILHTADWQIGRVFAQFEADDAAALFEARFAVVVMPSLVQIQRCDPPPSSTGIPYYQLWKEQWKQINFEGIKKAWLKE